MQSKAFLLLSRTHKLEAHLVGSALQTVVLVLGERTVWNCSLKLFQSPCRARRGVIKILVSYVFFPKITAKPTPRFSSLVENIHTRSPQLHIQIGALSLVSSHFLFIFSLLSLSPVTPIACRRGFIFLYSYLQCLCVLGVRQSRLVRMGTQCCHLYVVYWAQTPWLRLGDQIMRLMRRKLMVYSYALSQQSLDMWLIRKPGEKQAFCLFLKKEGYLFLFCVFCLLVGCFLVSGLNPEFPTLFFKMVLLSQPGWL